MTDPQRYFGLMKRQEQRLDYIENTLPVLENVAHSLPPRPTFNEIARALKQREVPTSQRTDSGSNWVAQTAQDLLFVDGPEPSPATIALRPHRSDGFLLSAARTFEKCEIGIRLALGPERLEYERRRLRDHMKRTLALARALRSTFGYPE